ncbi:hypothetical protein A3767_28185 [Oleiphilus sp. HI0133]|nr:hypothetical protein A3767_28185 [Oleiphilus sp. HI0133]
MFFSLSKHKGDVLPIQIAQDEDPFNGVSFEVVYVTEYPKNDIGILAVAHPQIFALGGSG